MSTPLIVFPSPYISYESMSSDQIPRNASLLPSMTGMLEIVCTGREVNVITINKYFKVLKGIFIFLIESNYLVLNMKSLHLHQENENGIITLEEDNVHIKETITIKNVIDKPIVPGYSYKNLKSSTQKEMSGISLINPVDVTNLAVTFEGKQMTDILPRRPGCSIWLVAAAPKDQSFGSLFDGFSPRDKNMLRKPATFS